MNSYTLPLADTRATLEVVGGKGASLARLLAAKLPVPGGFHVTTEAYRRFVAENDLQAVIMAALTDADPAQPETLETASRTIRGAFDRAPVPGDVAQAVTCAYRELRDSAPAVAIRSSATAEDLPDASFAGQQETYLNVTGPEAVLEAVRRCWASLWTARAIAYRMRQGIDPDAVSLAVVVQIMVPADASGIMFTANPMTGRRNEAVINAAWGLGEAIVGGLVTPDTLTIDKTTGGIVQRQIAHKEVMTVRVDGTTTEHPVPEKQRNAPTLDDAHAGELVRLGKRIEDLYGQPMDIEWTLEDGQFAVVQARPITALPESPAPTIDWTLPNPKDRYMRVSICELMPDPLSPLFSTLCFAAIEQGINRMAEDLMALPTGTLSGYMQTVNGYAYQYLSFTGRQWWMMLSRMVPRFPRLLRVGVSYWRNVAYPRYEETVRRWSACKPHEMTVTDLLAGVNEIMSAFAFHLGALMGSTMGPSAGSEGLFTTVYRKVAMRPGDPTAPTFLMGFDNAPIQAEKALYDLAMWCRERVELAAYLASTPANRLAGQMTDERSPEGVPPADWAEWQQRFHAHLEQHGSSIYDMDFMKPLPLDEPGPILETLKLFINGQGKNPYERQQAYVARREQAVAAMRTRLSGWLRGLKRWSFEKTLRWAQSQAPLREDGIAAIGLGYPALRRLLRELGRRFAEASMIEQSEDIYWLEQAEVEEAVAALERGDSLPDARNRVLDRKALWQARKQVTPPPMLPPKTKYLGMNMEGMLASRAEGGQENVIHGVGASPGQTSGIARVLHGPDDFAQMQPGDVLVASITTPAWTPLFAMASAVVTDIGGPLSHGSIVAREYGIPAVLGTGVATKRITSGQRITVDGSAGTVVLSAE
jgi:phosphohistidine swiveling domain-containing protein